MKNFLLIISLMCSIFGFAQNGTKTEPSEGAHHIGLHAGTTTGLGFSYRFWPGKIGFQLTGVPIFDSHSSFVSAGASFLYKFNDNEVVDFFGYVGNHLLHRTYGYNNSTNLTYNASIGIGLKIDFLEVLNFNLQAGYGVYNMTETVRTRLAGEVGLYYNL
ncbi:hypothetical protein [Crocinitomix algicola]|uniref:hypothetical protein n=1 Tax=Crocinitomix algicola TaxID=1740263 RepID=UPI0008720CF0|nr:hypothetical protein [Crocinitomix algicola]